MVPVIIVSSVVISPATTSTLTAFGTLPVKNRDAPADVKANATIAAAALSASLCTGALCSAADLVNSYNIHIHQD